MRNQRKRNNGYKSRYSRVVRVVRPIAQNELRMCVELTRQVFEDANGDSFITMWTGNILASTPNNVTYFDQPEYQAVARAFRVCRVTSIGMEASVNAFFEDGRYCTGAILGAGDGSNFPLTVPPDPAMSALQIKKIVSSGQSSKIWFNCNREQDEALQADMPTDGVILQSLCQVASLGVYSTGVPPNNPTALVICKWWITLSGRRVL